MSDKFSFPADETHASSSGSIDERPPSYSDVPDSSIVSKRLLAAETTTVTTTTKTTRTTTQLFSLPVWRRRPGASAIDDNNEFRSGVGEDGLVFRTLSLNLDKDLPDLPTFDGAAVHNDRSQTGPLNLPLRKATPHRPHAPSMILSQSNTDESFSTTFASSRNPSSSIPYSQPTRVLAQAALGLGLPRAIHLSPAAPLKVESGRSTQVRRAKSLSRFFNNDDLPSSNASVQQPRPCTATGSAGSSKGKGVQIQHSTEEPPPLARRSSFWNRRRVQSMKDLQLDDERLKVPAAVPSLPAMQPVSPFFVAGRLKSSPDCSPDAQSTTFRTSSTTSLRRRHSDRQASSHSSRSDTIQFPDPPPVPKRSPKRPRTANAVLSPLSRALSDNDDTSPKLHAPQPERVVDPSHLTLPTPRPRSNASRPRSATSSNILHRLSMGIFPFSSQPASPISSPTVTTNILADRAHTSSPPAFGNRDSKSSVSKSTISIPKPVADEDSPELYVMKLEEAVSKAEIAHVLATSSDPFYVSALQVYIDRFDFASIPLDVALRRLLMDVGLPKETQQIDRVMEAFASRYWRCNPGLFISSDHPYILAFSLIMLHTDAFNKSNKRKMTKADYIKNTKLVGVSSDVLDYFFDNIVFAPFIFIEDPVDVNGQRGFTQDGLTSRISHSPSGYATPDRMIHSTMRTKTTKVDPYFLITRNLLNDLRVDVESHIPVRNPYSYQGTAGSWNEWELRRSFALARKIEVDAAENKRVSTLPFFSISAGGIPGHTMTGMTAWSEVLLEADGPPAYTTYIRVTKVGVLNRKDDLTDGGKRAPSRKWKEWSLILTGSQLLFFREASVALNLLARIEQPRSILPPSQLPLLRPDELVSVKESIAIYDASYTKHPNTFRLVLPNGRQLLLIAESEQQRNEWIAHINYASAFKTAGIRMRAVHAGGQQSGLSPDPSSNGSPQRHSIIPPSLNVSASCVSNDTPAIHVDSPTEGPHDHSRMQIVRHKVHEIEEKISTAQAQLDAEMRSVKNLAVLTPFQRSTRDRVQAAVIGLSRTIRHLRLDVIKWVCHRDVLAADLAAEVKEGSIGTVSLPQGGSINSFAAHDNNSSASLAVHVKRGGEEEPSTRPASSICESFHSALDFSTEWPLNNRPSVNTTTPATQSVEPSVSTFFLNGDVTSEALKASRPAALPLSPTLPRDNKSSVTELSSHIDSFDEMNEKERSSTPLEEAEDWDKTRAARRVSLVRLPGGIAGRSRTPQGNVSGEQGE